MSIGNLVVTLTLQDGQYQASMRNAGQAAQNLSGSFGGLNGQLSSTQKGMSNLIPHLRDVALITASLHSIVAGFKDTFGALAGSFIKANSDIEKTTVLLTGLSKSLDTKGKAADAAKDMEYLFTLAKGAPFSIKELSNAFVKMRTVGLDDVEGKVKSLSDAIANFGGDDQALHRSTIAIQQMASKGVISMEELRQQLGESVPNAMQMMADGMGLTMQTFLKEVSSGRVKALPAVNGMLSEMELSMAGSSERMMNTWSGMTSQFATNWMMLQKDIGDNGSFDTLKQMLKDLNGYLKSDDAVKFGQTLGDAVGTGVSAIQSLVKAFSDNKSAISNAANALFDYWLIIKSIGPLQALVSGLTGAFGAQGTMLKSLTALTLTWRNALYTTATVSTINWTAANGAMWSLAPTITRVTTLTRGWTLVNGVLSATFATITGPIGMLAIAVGVLAYNYVDWGNKATENIDKAIAKHRELEVLSKNGKNIGSRLESGSFKTYEDLARARVELEDKKKKQLEMEKTANRASSTWVIDNAIGGEKVGNGVADEAKKRAENLAKEIKIVNADIARSSRGLFDSTAKAQIESAQKAVNESMALRTTEYNLQKDLLNKQVENAIAAGMKITDADKLKSSMMLDLNQKELKGQEQDLVKMLDEQKAIINEYKSQFGNINTFEVDQERIKGWQNSQAAIMVSMAKMRVEMDATNDAAKKADIGKALAGKEAELKKAADSIKALTAQMKSLKETGALGGENIIRGFTEAAAQIDIITEKLGKVRKEKEAIENGGSLIGAAALDGTDSKAMSKETTRAENVRKKLMGSLTDLAGSGNSKLAEILSSYGEEDSPELKKWLNVSSKSSDPRLAAISNAGKELSAFDIGNAKNVDDLRLYNEKVIDLTETIKKYEKAQKDAAEIEARLAKGRQDIGAYKKQYEDAKAGKKTSVEGIYSESTLKLEAEIAEKKKNAAAYELTGLEKALAIVQKIESRTKDSLARNTGKYAISTTDTGKHAIGKMQVMPSTLKDPGMPGMRGMDIGDLNDRSSVADLRKFALSHVEELKKFGEDYYKALVRLYKGDYEKAAAAYNTGAKHVNQAVAMQKKHGGDWASYLPYDETKKYMSDFRSGMKKPGADFSDDEKNLDMSRQADILSNQTSELKKKIAEQEALNRQEERRTKELTKVMVEAHISANKQIADAEAAQTMDGKKIFQNQQNDLVNAYRERVFKILPELDKEYGEEQKSYLKRIESAKTFEEKRALIEKEAMEHAESLRKAEEIKSLNETAKKMIDLKNSSIISSIQNSAGTSFGKDMQVAMEQYRQEMAQHDRTPFAGEKAEQADALLINEKMIQSLAQVKAAHKDAFTAMINDEVDFKQVAGQAATDFTNGMTDAIASLVVNGSKNFKQLTANVLNGISQMLIKMALLKAVQAGVGLLGGFADGGVAGGGSTGSSSSGAAAFANGGTTFDIAKYATRYADGGGTKLASKQTMLSGGVKSSPHVALFAEAGVPEAFIPMHDRKSIPISVIKDENGNISAKALLPGGRSIPATVKQSNFADGGTTMGDIASSMTSGASSTKFINDDLSASISKGVEASMIKAFSQVNFSKQLSKQGLTADKADSSAQSVGHGGVSITINVDGSGNATGGSQASGQSDQSKSSQNNSQAAMWNSLASNIKSLVVQTIAEQKRQGGQLWQLSAA